MEPLATISSNELVKAFTKCLQTVSKNPLHHTLQHVNLHITEAQEFTIGSSDGYRASIWKVLSHTVLSDSWNAASLCLGVEDVKRLLGLIGKSSQAIGIEFSNEVIRFNCLGVSVEFPTPKIEYPSLVYSIPKDTKRLAVVSRGEIEFYLESLDMYENKNKNIANLDIKVAEDYICFKPKNMTEYIIPGDIGFGDTVVVKTSRHLLLNAIKTFKCPEIQLLVKDSMSPLVLKDVTVPNFWYLLMLDQE